MERYKPAKVLSRFDRIKYSLKKGAIADLNLKHLDTLRAGAIADLKHQDTHITEHLTHPYYHGAVFDYPKEYYRTLLLQYSLDINAETPINKLLSKHGVSCALSDELAAIFIQLLNIELTMGLNFDAAELGKDERIIKSKPALRRLLEDSRFFMTDAALDKMLNSLSYDYVYGYTFHYNMNEGRELFKHMLDHALQPNYEFANHERLIDALMLKYRKFGVDILFEHPDFDLNYVRERYPELYSVGDDQHIRERQERLARLIEKEN